MVLQLRDICYPKLLGAEQGIHKKMEAAVLECLSHPNTIST